MNSEQYETYLRNQNIQQSANVEELQARIRELEDQLAAPPKCLGKSGKFLVRLPVSLHAGLEREARREGVSLNQLVVAKLAVALGTLTRREP